jgi:tellurite resistance protein
MAKKKASLLASFFTWAANQLLAPRLRHANWVRSELRHSLSTTLALVTNQPTVSLAILEGAMAIALADGEFEQEEWELYSSLMGQLQLSDGQLQGLSIHGELDLEVIAKTLTGIENSTDREAISSCYCLLAAADGEADGQEQGVLRKLLEALGHGGMAGQLPRLANRFRRREGRLASLRGHLGEWFKRQRSSRPSQANR